MEEAVFKTTVMGGFNKSEVLAFIDKQDEQFREKEKELLAKIDSLSTGLKNETLRSENLEKQIEELKEELNAEKEKNADALEKLHTIGVEAKKADEAYTADLESRDAEIQRLKEEAAALRDAKREAEEKAEKAVAYAEELKDKLELIDKTKEQIGRALLEAQQAADNIINSANEEAEAIKERARNEAQQLIDEAESKAEEMTIHVKEKLDSLLGSVKEYKERIMEARTDAANFFSTIDSVFDAMQSNSDDIFNTFSSAFNTSENTETEDEPTEETDTVKFDFSSTED